MSEEIYIKPSMSRESGFKLRVGDRVFVRLDRTELMEVGIVVKISGEKRPKVTVRYRGRMDTFSESGSRSPATKSAWHIDPYLLEHNEENIRHNEIADVTEKIAREIWKLNRLTNDHLARKLARAPDKDRDTARRLIRELTEVIEKTLRVQR